MNEVCFSVAGIAVITGLLGVLSGTVVALFKLLQAAKDGQIATLTMRANAYEHLANQSVNAMEAAVNAKLNQANYPPFTVVPPVEPEHNSPVSPDQQADADVATLRARSVAAMRALGLNE